MSVRDLGLRTPAAAVTASGLGAACVAAAAGPASPWFAGVALATLPVLVVLREPLRSSRARWAPWTAVAITGGALSRLVPGAGPLGLALEGVACAAAGARRAPAEVALVTFAALALEGATCAAVWAGRARGLPAEALEDFASRGLALAGVAGVVSFLGARQRREIARLELAVRRLSQGPGAEEDAAVAAAREGGARGAELPATAAGQAELVALLDLARHAVGARTAALWERSTDPPCWRMRAAVSSAEELDAARPAPLGHGLVAWTARQPATWRLDRGGPQLKVVPWYANDVPTGSFLGVPLGHDDEAAEASLVLTCDAAEEGAFADDAPEHLERHARALADRLALESEVERKRPARDATGRLRAAAASCLEGRGLDGAAHALLRAALGFGGAAAGAVVAAERWPSLRAETSRAAAPAAASLASGGRGPLVLAAHGLRVASGHRLGADEETWTTWASRHPDTPVRLAAHGPDRGMPRIAKGDGLDASWSVLVLALEGADAPGAALALAWPERRLPETSTLEGLEVLARLGGQLLRRHESDERLARSRQLDGLTDLPVRSAFLRRAELALDACAERRQRCSLAVFEVEDSSRLFVDAGADRWEEMLEALARTLVAALPDGALACRWEEDRFVVLLPATSEEGALVAARRAAAATAAGALAGLQVTLAGGVATVVATDEARLADLLERAGEALDQARGRGPGRVLAAAPRR